jgi:hypothetical protein
VRWEAGQLTAADHPDAEEELVLAALGGDRAECVELAESWAARNDDLEVLVLGPRSAADELTITPEEIERLRRGPGWMGFPGGSRAGFHGGAFVVRNSLISVPASPLGQAAMAWRQIRRGIPHCAAGRPVREARHLRQVASAHHERECLFFRFFRFFRPHPGPWPAHTRLSGRGRTGRGADAAG